MKYYNPTLPQIYPDYYAIRHLHPNKSLPRNVDIPSLNLYQIYPTNPPIAQEGYYVSSKPFPELNSEDGKYYQAWEILPIPAEG
jgi:hypothetical protein